MTSDNFFSSSYYRSALALAVLIYLITAWNSNGYYHPDEHYQIIEFAGQKLGANNADELPWEWRTQSRQAIQPLLAYLVFSGLQFIGINDVYLLAFALRLLSLIVSLFSVHFFLKMTLMRIKPSYRKLYVALSYFLWFLPVIYVHFSSETWSAAMLLFAFSLALSDRLKGPGAPLFMGLFLGLAFLFRYQSALLAFGLLGWLIFVHKERPGRVIKLMATGLLVVFAGSVVDSWYYGNWVFVPWRYLNYQVLQGVTTEFGVSDWYFYFTDTVLAAGWPLGVIFLASLIYLIIRAPKSPLVWIVIPFVVVHSIIPHKEIRFFFVLVNLLPLIFVTSLQHIPSFRYPAFFKIPFGFVVVLLSLLNALGLAAMAFKPAGNGRQEISGYIHNHFSGLPVNLIYTSWASPYNPWHQMPAKFYVDRNVSEQRIQSLCALNEHLINKGKKNLLVVRMAEFDNAECTAKLSAFRFTRLKQSIPGWIEYLNSFYGRFDEKEVLVLFELNDLE